MDTSVKFVLDRSRWFRGDSQGSMLLRSWDWKMCCLGLFLESCGVPVEKLRNVHLPSYVNFPLPPKAKWTCSADITYPEGIVHTNDSTTMKEEDREKRLIALFALQGVELTFVDSL